MQGCSPSKVFMDLFSQPKSGPKVGLEEEGTVDGCQSMRVADSCYDFKQLLRVLHDGIGEYASIQHTGKWQSNFLESAALVRLGHQYYCIVPVYDAGMIPLRGVFGYRSLWTRKRDGRCEPGKEKFIQYVDMISAANLFRTIGKPDLRAVALYLCSDYVQVVLLVLGAEHADGCHERLAPDNLIRCLNARTSLLSRRLTYVNNIVAFATSP
ncbi:hypothetical protein GY45DRAFT_1382913 [Cubamyces sp. BRFM 1775]|nr:hypothetical protein GY45DRAFT_1382913 [Cubamyces sp. BRFM 1775]